MSIPFRAIARSFGLNMTAAGAALAGTFVITWSFGLAEFAYYTINLAKLSIILLGAELLPSSFTVFRLQDDENFVRSVPIFYAAFALVAAGVTAILIEGDWLAHASWFMIPFVLTAVLQRYLDAQAQASGRIDAYFWIPATTNIARLTLLTGLAWLKALSVPDVLWLSLAIAGLLGQVVMLRRFPEFLDRNAWRQPRAKLGYLWSIRGAYYGYYLNSVLKRVKDTFLPLLSDVLIPSKAEIGRFFVYTRANEAVCGQIRLLEAYLVNRSLRDNLRRARRLIFFSLAPIGQALVTVTALALMYRSGVTGSDVALAIVTGFLVYPYILELFWRNDALASFNPRQVAISLIASIVGLALPPICALLFWHLDTPALVAGYVLGQTFSAATYRISNRRTRSSVGSSGAA